MADGTPTPSAEMRELSKAAFGHAYSLELAGAIRDLGSGFTREQVLSLSRDRSDAAGIDPPGQTAVFAELRRLRTIGATERLPPMGEAVRRDAIRESGYWAYCAELAARLTSAPTNG